MIERVASSWACISAPHDYGDHPSNFRESSLLQLSIPDWRGSSIPPSIMHRYYWNLIGGFSIEFSPGMYSDPDICRKLWAVGVRNFRGVGNSLVYHFMSKSIGRVKKNDGRRQFLRKWGISSKTFMKYFLGLHAHVDARYTSPQNQPSVPLCD